MLGKEIPSSLRSLKALAIQLLIVDAIEGIDRQYSPLKRQINRFVTIPFLDYEKNAKVEENELYLAAEVSQRLRISHI